jgi:hypothetical protein
MNLILIFLGFIMLCFVVGLILIIFSKVNLSSFSLMEIIKTGFNSISLIVLIIIFLVLTMSK